MADQIGSAEFELRARRDQLKKDLNDAQRDLKQFADGAEATANQSAGGISRATRMIGVAVGALAAVFTVAITGAFAVGRASLKMAEDISNSAQRIGVGTSALQEWQYVARKTGEESNAVSGALETFANKLAAAAAGLSKVDLKTFQALGLSQEQLKGMDDTEKALDEVIDRIGALKDESDRAAIAEKLGLDPLATALRGTSEEVARLRDEARDLGFVMDEELIRKGAAASEQMEDLSQIIGIQMAEAFISLSDEVLAFTGYIAGAVNGLNGFLETFSRFKQRTNAMYGDDFVEEVRGGNPLQALISAGRATLSGRTGRAAESIRNGLDLVDTSPVDPGALAALAEPPRAPRVTPEYNSTLTAPAGRTRADNSAQRAAEREARRAERVEQEIFRARQRLLDVAEGDLLTARDRYDLALDQLKMDREARDAEIKSKETRGEYTKVEAARLRTAHEEADALEDRVMIDNHIREARDEELANTRILADLSADLVSLQLGAARTAKERERLELELLAIVQKQRRDALDAKLSDTPGLTDADRQGAWDQNTRIEQAEREAVNRANLTPIEQWRDASLKTADEIAEAYESIAARGLDSLNDGIVDAIMNSRSLGEVFHNVAQQIIADLLQIAVRRGITDPLANAIFPQGGGSGGGNMFASFAAMLGRQSIPGFASGVTNFSGGLAYVHQGEVLANLAPGTDVIPAHAVGAKGPGIVVVEFRDGPAFAGKVLEVSGPVIVQAAATAYNSTRADQATASRRSRQRFV